MTMKHAGGRVGARIRGRSRARLAPLPLLLFAALLALLPCLPARADDDSGPTTTDQRDFPPLRNPQRPAPTPSQPSQPVVPAAPTQPVPTTPAQPPTYTLGVGDDLQLSVLGQPNYSATLKVRPDGAITAPAAGTIYVLGRTPEDVGKEIQEKLAQYLRNPRVDLMVANTTGRSVYVMGEVYFPGEKVYRPGLTALQALGQSGGVRVTGKPQNVIVLRRTTQSDAEMFKRDLRAALKGTGPGEDMALEPYDIVFVPPSLVGNIGTFIDLYLRPALVPVSLYLTGWDAFNINNQSVRLSGGR